ncbi:conserved unknown protein [Ectocarpus siliculosus]|uniref:EsV-1-7 n=1 Tax=Ectocarpus siliculosus TaxID=2880 RepID=D7G083_ECTSI|nr:conserved unknown protein [Ectocarpus siliculosus]|eukprot:CBJ32965.1 conserved unknown protein [Ectocarpus siliculosus]
MSPPVARSYEETFSREGDDWRRRLQTIVFSATPPAETRPPDGHENGLPVEDGPETRGLARCERGVEESRLPQDGGVISPPRTEDKKPAVASRTEYCKHAGCTRTPRYGRKNGPLTLCQSHKRAGLYTVRDGVLLVATRDGSAFREKAGSSSSVNSNKNGTATGAAARRKCEAPDCTIQPSYGDPGTSRPRFCSSHKEKQMVSLKNRPCLFPGCDIRPHYGLSMGRAVYCVSHKKDGMVHLLKEAKNLEKEELKRKRRKCGEVEKDQGDRDSGHDGEEQAGSAEGSLQQRKKKKKAKREGTKRPSGSHGKPTNKKKSTNTAASPSHLRTAGQSALAPSDDMRLLQNARQSAHEEASGSGRRARVPSRKVLEASGKMADETAQWMTKEKKEEQARINKRFRAQRKAAAAAGLKIGEVIEATASPAARAESEEEGLGSGGTSIRGGGLRVSKASWRKLTPTEILPAAGKKPSAEGAASEVRGNDAAMAETTDEQVVGRQPETAPVASDGGDRSERKPAETMASGAEMSSQEDSTTTNAFNEGSLKRRKKNQVEHSSASSESEKGRYRVQQAGRQTSAVKVVCELDSCSRTAKFGVHGIVRYCSRHRIFGMHKIVGVKKSPRVSGEAALQ